MTATKIAMVIAIANKATGRISTDMELVIMVAIAARVIAATMGVDKEIVKRVPIPRTEATKVLGTKAVKDLGPQTRTQATAMTDLVVV